MRIIIHLQILIVFKWVKNYYREVLTMHGINDVGQIEIHTGEIRICRPLSNRDLLIHAKINGNSYLLNVENVNVHSVHITLKHCIAVIIINHNYTYL
jgi:hypothetical protein